MMPPAAERGREVRQRLLAAAAELVVERGWGAVSTRVLAQRAGVTASVVHYHFRSVSAVLDEAAVGVMRRALEEVAAVVDTASTPAGAVDAMLGAVTAYSGSDPSSVLAVEAYLAARRDDDLHAEIGRVLDDFRRRLAHLLAGHGVGAPEATAAVLAAAVDGLLLHRGLAADPDTKDVGRVLRRLVDQPRRRERR